MIAALLLIIITLFIPPLGVLLVAGCGADFCINLLLTILGYFPGHIHVSLTTAFTTGSDSLNNITGLLRRIHLLQAP
jgi:uncharacterized membrane protein YqaE (UPF0057 family)